MIAADDADVMLAGGAEGTRSARWASPASRRRARSRPPSTTQPEKASRPYDKDRDGFVMGEGAGDGRAWRNMSMREGARRHDVRRGDRLRALRRRLSRHRAASRRVDGAFRSMEMALRKSGLAPADIDYINAHGTSTPLGDELELGAVRRLFGDAIGGRLDVLHQVRHRPSAGRRGRGGERSSASLAMRDQIVPPTLNLDNPSDSCVGVDLVPMSPRGGRCARC